MSCCGAVSAESIVEKYPNSGKGRVAIVTGANTGLGKTTSQALVSAGFNVIIAGRTISALETAKKEIYEELSLKAGEEAEGGRISILKTPLDLASVASIKAYVQDFLEQKLGLHVLINNAGVSNYPGKTKDGLDNTMGVNWFGGFFLTQLLLDVLKASKPSRVIIVASSLHAGGRLTVDNLEKKIYTPEGFNDFIQAYNDSKLANILHCRALAVRLKDTGVSVFCLHPGWVRTEVTRNLPFCFKWGLRCFGCCLKSPSDGAATSVHCAIAVGVESHSGEYFMDCRVAKPSNRALKDDTVSEALWAKGEELTKKFS